MSIEDIAAYQMGFEKGMEAARAVGAVPPAADVLKAQEQGKSEAQEQADVLAGLENQYASLMHAKQFQQALIVNGQIKALRAKQ